MTDALPPRYYVLTSRISGRRYLDDGSNFVQWLNDDDDPVALAWQNVARKEKMRADYIAARAEGMRTNPGGWRHADCDHAYGICSG